MSCKDRRMLHEIFSKQKDYSACVFMGKFPLGSGGNAASHKNT